VNIETFFYEQSSYPTNFGITFDKTYVPPNLPIPPIPLTDFYNNIQNLTLISATNCPFSKNGNQFAGITPAFNIQSSFKPYFLPGTSLAGCFSGCTLFNSDISFLNTSNVTNMESMFNNAITFNQDIGNWDVSNVLNMSSMFQQATAFNQDIGGWDVSKVTSMSSMFELTTFNNGGSSTINNWSAPLSTRL
jgi:surface protein